MADLRAQVAAAVPTLAIVAAGPGYRAAIPERVIVNLRSSKMSVNQEDSHQANPRMLR